MLLQQAANYNLDVAILDPDPQAACYGLTPFFRPGKLTDYDTVISFGADCDVLSIEIENVNTTALKALRAQGKKVFPQPEIIELIQDKRTQKQFYQQHNIPTAAFVLTETADDVARLWQGQPVVHKLGREGYDGRGVQVIRSAADLAKAFDKPGLLEQMVDINKEISVIIARNEQGETRAFPAVELVYHPEHNMVDYLISPADIPPHLEEEAHRLATRVIDQLGMVGLLAVEMFIDQQGQVLVNEIAPRPHNSGHQSIEANYSSQFDQHLRAVLGWPLGAIETKLPSAMVNLLGEAGFTGNARYLGMEQVLALPGANVHLYGKKETRPFRKMGHVTLIAAHRTELVEKVNFVKNTLKITAWDKH